MENNEKIRIAITAGVVAAILLILVLFLALSGRNKNDDEELSNNISEYASLGASGEALLEDAISNASNEAADSESSESASFASTVMSYSEYADTKTGSVSGNSFYATKNAVLKDKYKGLAFDVNAQLAEMMGYWADGNTDAVRDLAHLDRFEAMSYKLTGTDNFYYFGDLNQDGLPNGTGIAVYAEDQYYYGQWVNGVRQGNGTWFNFYPSYSDYVVTEHMYSGSFTEDLPGGDGQEHYDYDYAKMNAEDIYLQNAIGSFKDGLYNGDMYIITVDQNGDITEWYGTCEEGTWKQVNNTYKDKKGNTPVLSESEDPDNHVYMSEKAMSDSGITGIISGGTVIK